MTAADMETMRLIAAAREEGIAKGRADMLESLVEWLEGNRDEARGRGLTSAASAYEHMTHFVRDKFGPEDSPRPRGIRINPLKY